MSISTLQPAIDKSLAYRASIGQWLALAGVATVYLVIFFYYYPPTYGIEDEVGFINQGLVFSRGALSAEGAGFEHLEDFIESHGRHVGWRNPGRSLLIVPLLKLGGVPAVFVSGALIHLLVTLVASLILARLGRSPLWSILILCHPTLAIYSRTIMGDEPAALGLTCALLAFVSTPRPGWWAGIAIGLGACMRYQAGLALPFFALAILTAPHVAERRRQALYCLLGGGIFGLGLMAYNEYLFGNLTGWVNQGYFALRFVPRNLGFWTAALCVFWPLMFPALFLDRSPIRWAVRSVCLPLLLLMLAWHAFDIHSSWAYTLVIGQRYLIPILPAWIITYALCLGSLLSRGGIGIRFENWSRLLATGGCIGLLVLLAVVFQRHDVHLRLLQSARDEVARIVPGDSLVISNYTIQKLFAVPSPDLPVYRWRTYEDHGVAQDQASTIRDETRCWYLVLLPKAPGAEIPDLLQEYVTRYQMTRIPTDHPTLILYKSERPIGMGDAE